jgi:hypothetical protein
MKINCSRRRVSCCEISSSCATKAGSVTWVAQPDAAPTKKGAWDLGQPLHAPLFGPAPAGPRRWQVRSWLRPPGTGSRAHTSLGRWA